MSETATSRTRPIDVGIVLYEGVEILDVAGPAEVFAQAARLAEVPGYRLDYRAATGNGRVTSSAGLGLAAEPLGTPPHRLDTLLVPGAPFEALERALDDERMLRWLDDAACGSRRVASVCTGAFLLGALGRLRGRRATTHWAGLEELARRHPDTTVEDATLWVRDGELWTSAGVLSGVDLALAMVRSDYGADVALRIARRLVVYLVRDGAQSQFSAPMDLQARAGRSDLSSLVAWLQNRLAERTNVEEMAEQMATSVRSLHRRCREVFDRTPAQLFTELRLEEARVLLQQSPEPLARIADRCGYASASALTKAFTQRYGTAPTRFRERFRATEAAH